MRDMLQRIGRMKRVAGIQKNQVVALGFAKALVHSVVNSLIRRRQHPLAWVVEPHRQFESAVGRGAVDYQVLVKAAGLRRHALKSRQQVGFGVVSHRND